MLIDCNTCEMRGRECGDCIVSFLTIEVRPSDRAPVEVDDAQAGALAALADGGLVPPLRLVQGGGGDAPPAERARRRAG
ncbi:hypothetical protein [Demequina pelophila]|uniref:hypothetical protein n=1 Tax=Demequina pelophila TaxID=1638984 RepID=UPI000783EF7E|nr:hypothetical protein [Demequina pelophila]